MQGRGSRGSAAPSAALRAVTLLAVLAATTEAVRLLVTPPLTALARQVAGGQAWDSLALAPVVAGGCAAALAACWAWLVVCAVVVTVGALRGVRGDVLPAAADRAAGPSRLCPRLVRTLVVTALGLAVTTGPVTADSGAPGPMQHAAGADPSPGLLGLSLPDRVPASGTTARQTAPFPHVARVRSGDSLWAIAERHLPAGAPDSEVQRGWRLLAAANADRLGSDPDLIFPGTVLRVPPLGSTPESTH